MPNTPQSLQGQVALVTGAARGIGRACAVELAKAGVDIALGLRDINADAGAVDEIESLGRRVLPLQMDFTRLNEITAAVEKAHAHFGRIDILVDNPGIAPANLAVDVTEADFDNTLAVNRSSRRSPSVDG